MPISRPSLVRGRLAPLSVALLSALFALALLGSGSAQAAVVCPNPVPVVNENQCHDGSGTSEWEVWDYSSELGGFPTKTSVNLGESVTLKIGRNGPVSPTKTVNISVYRMGYYDGLGGRLVNSASKVAINNTFQCEAMNEVTGEVSCANWSPTYTIPASAFPSSGVYIAKLVASTGDETQIVFTVRDDSRQPKAEVLYVLPVATYEAYNTFGGKSLYYGTEGGNTVSGTSRAVKVSFQRPLAQVGAHLNWFTGPDIDLLQWLEKQGYDVAYTDDVQLQSHPEELLNHRVDVISGHSEYWSEGQFKGFLAAREAGINIASFSANTAYWKVRYEDNNNTLVCYKTVEGSGSTGNGSVSENDWGPDGIKGTADDALGKDGIAGTADDNPQNSTTTFRDNGAPPGDPSAPPGGRVGPDMPENQLFGIMYVGDNDAQDYPITVPPGNANEEFASSRIWRNTGISGNSTTNIGSGLVGWEWDAIPTQAQYLSHEPKGVKSIYATNVQTVNTNSWILDEGRLRNTEPPPGQPGKVGGVTYTAASGAEVFASGTMQWSYGLSSEADERIQQATYNIFSDMGVQPNTAEEGLHLDPAGSNRAPNGGFTISQNPAKTNTSITFDASASHDPDGTIAKYEWDLDGNGTYETNTGSKATVTHSYSAEGEYTVGLRVTDNNGATGTAVRTLTIINNLPPTASFTATPSVVVKGEPISFSGAGSSDPDGTIAKYEWDFDGNGTYETNGGSNPVISHSYSTPGTYTVGLRVTDNGGKTATTTRPVSVNSGEVSKYSDSVLATAGLVDYWRMGETSGTSFADSAGSSPATTFGEPTLGVPGAVKDDPDRAAEFDGVNDAAKAAVNLSGTHAATVEFWLKWNSYANDDRLAMEFTNNFNETPGGFLVDPNAPQFGGTFGVGIGSGTSRNTVYFERPSAGEWHHYAFVLDTSAAAAQQITPYVDGKVVAYQKGDSGSGGGNFANSTLNFMSRSASGLFGAGGLDEVAIYKRTLGPTTIADHYKAIVPSGGGEGGPEGGEGEKEPEKEKEKETGGSGGEGPATYSNSVLGTPTLLNYWRMGEASGPTLADSKGSSPATATGGPTFGVPGSLKGDANTAVRFDGVNDAASASLNLSSKSAITVEFWLKWNSYANDDRLAMEFTNNFNEAAGGFIVDPNAPQMGGSFGVGIGQGASRNNVFFARPTAGQWHHYAFVLNTSAPAAQQITPYVDGKAIAYTKLDSGTGAGNFANSTLNLMSRAGGSLFGTGEMDEVSVYGSALSAATVENNFKGIVPEGGGKEEKEEAKEETGTPVTYSESVLGTPGLSDYWRLGESSGSVFADSVGPSPASIAGEPTLGVPGAISKDPDKAARFDGINDSASAAVDLSGKSAITVEFWLKWNSYANDDRLAMEFTNNFNETPGGFLIDPNSSYGSFAVGIGSGASRNTTLFPRPTAGQWHHYAFVLNTTAPAAEEVIPYVDGEAVAYSKPESGSGAPTFANSTLNFMSRGGTGLFGAGDLDEVALYGRALSAATIANHFHGVVTNKRPVASFSAPSTAKAGESVSFDASASSDAEGPIAKYEWDLDGDSTYETDTGTTPTVSHTYSSNGPVQVGLRVTDGSGSTASTSHSLTVEGETSGGPTSYKEAVLGTTGLRDYWRMGEGSGSILADSAGPSPATTSGEPVLGVPGSVFGDPDTAVRFDGVNDSASAPVDLSSASTITVEFWLKWNSYANNDALAMELTNNFNEADGGFLVDPNSSYGSFAVGIGRGASRNVTLFPRPSAGLWHHYALVLNTTAPAAEEVIPYVDGEAVSYSKAESGTGAGNFANATLNFMSRAGSGLFGAGDLDEVAIYDRALSQATIAGHYKLAAHNMPPEASFTATPNPAPTNTSVSFDASGSTDVDGTVAKYEWDLDGNGTYETNTGTTPTVTRSYSVPGERTIGLRVTDAKGATGTTTRTLTIQNQLPVASFTATPNPVLSGVSTSFNASASKDPDGTIAKYEWDLDGNGSYETNTGTTPTVSNTFATPGAKTVGLRVTDNFGDTSTTTQTVTVENRAPTASFTATPNPVLSGVSTSFDASGSKDPDGTIAQYEWDLNGDGTYETNTGTTPTVSNTFATPGAKTVGLRVTDNSGATATTTVAVTVQNRAPSASITATPNPVVSGSNVTFDASGSKDSDGTIVEYEWDLDGNGTYETPGFGKSTTFVAYAKPGTRTVGVRVTDNSGATTTASLTVTIQNRAPSASFTATPNPVSPNATTTFDASASKDPDGTIAKYEWDLDGNGTYETNTGTKATTTRTYTSEGTVNVGLRVTDDSGATATTTVPVVVKNQAPTASFTATPNPANTNATVSFNAGASVDPDGTIAKYEWDLDGNGTYETNTGTTKTTSKSYATPGEVTVGLRVTDNKGATGTITKTITIQNQLPVPSFTVTPNPTTAGSTVTFNGSASKDPDGTIAKYEWDLNGDGTYETNTGTTATTSLKYATATEPVVGLRVTDNRGATATTTKTLVVRGPYNNAINGTAGLIDYWRLDEPSGTNLNDVIGGRDATALNGVTLGTVGNLTLDPDTAATFDGTNDAAQAAVNLSGTSKLTLEFWLKWNSYANDDKLAFEYTSNFNNTSGGFLVNPNSSTSGGQFEVAMGRSTTRNSIFFARPSAGVWHHYAIVLNAATLSPSITPYVDGKAVSFSKGTSSLGGGNFANSTLNFMSRNASSLFGAGSLDEVALYNQNLTATQIAQHFAAR